MQVSGMKHFPVMLDEVISALAPKNGEVYVDATFGNGGYSQKVLEAADCKVIAVDRDPTVSPRAQEFKKIYGERFDFRAGCFGSLKDLVNESVDGVMFDIGVSSMQLDEAKRGFSFAKAAPLDMRMSCEGTTAADIVNTMPEKELADLIYQYGEERKSRQIAAKIVAYRNTKPIETTTELAEIIYSVIHRSPQLTTDPATKTFQALRIAVNHELDELRDGLNAAVSILKPMGRIVVVSFHSLEDRIVKNFFRAESGNQANVSRYLPQNTVTQTIALTNISKAITPTRTELEKNPRSRSAKLRFAQKI